ncbi:hypothetical protein Celaphus_00017001 [Cervus elaphus hippelaphus]|uniref:SPATA31 domain-containing protein n=1 Tax=Cervus elaphus hippelaphus TaxID=46360 RepID=A0A212CMR9_CEREH|nr:hypothetical protein Celaphus_00017001 [Cervus elaphus hippelaphus]
MVKGFITLWPRLKLSPRLQSCPIATITSRSYGYPGLTPTLDSNHAPIFQRVFSQVTPNLPQENRSSQAHSSVSILPEDLISPNFLEKLEHHLSKRFIQEQRGVPWRIQASQKLIQSQDQFPRPCQAQGRKQPSRPPVGLGKSS